MGSARTTRSRRPLRRDAAENAERLLAAAIRTGLNEGKSVPMSEIAAAAGVGIGTLYRRYPNRDALLEQLQVRAYRILIDIAEDGLASGGRGLELVERFLSASFDRRDELVLPLHGAPDIAGRETEELAVRLRELMAATVDRGHRDGTVRTEVTARTIVQFGAMLAQPMSTTQGWDRTARDQRRVFLRGISASGT